MANSTGRNRVLVPEAQYGLDQFKLEIASEVGITNYDRIDKGNLTSRQNGTVGGNMVKRMVESYERSISGTTGTTGNPGTWGTTTTTGTTTPFGTMR